MLLEVENLRVSYGGIAALHGVDFGLYGKGHAEVQAR